MVRLVERDRERERETRRLCPPSQDLDERLDPLFIRFLTFFHLFHVLAEHTKFDVSLVSARSQL
jgi:hypothetical protein